MSEKPPESGVPEGKRIPLCEPLFGGSEWKYLQECLETNCVSSVGGYVDRFEKAAAERVGTRYAVATVNGTAALHMALLLGGVEPEDEVLVSALSFIGTSNTVNYIGAWPVFIDAEARHWQMDAKRVLEYLEYDCRWSEGVLTNRRTGRRVSAIVPSHILGHPVDLDAITAAAEKYKLTVIEDAGQSLGAKYRGAGVGGRGRMGCLSFNGNKIVTTGGGGMLVTNDEALAKRARYLTTQAKDDPIEYVHQAVGYDYRLTNLLAAMGCAQMEQLDAFIAAKRKIAARYRQAWGAVPWMKLPEEAAWASSTFWLYAILINRRTAGFDSRQLQKWLETRGIQSRPLWQPLNLSPAHMPPHSLPCPVAVVLHQDGLCVPCSAGLTADDQETVIEAVLSLTDPEKAAELKQYAPGAAQA